MVEQSNNEPVTTLHDDVLQDLSAPPILASRHRDKPFESNEQEHRADELAASLALLEATLESSADGIAALDRTGRLINYNSKFLAIWDVPQGLVEQRDGLAIITHAATQVNDSQAFLRRVEELQKRPEEPASDIIECKDGRTLERYRLPLKAGEECIGVVINYRDISERKSAEATQSFYRAIIDSSDDAIISKTLDGIITSWNQGAERIFGYSAEEVIGKSILILIPPHLQHEEPVILSRLRHGERIAHYETVRVKKNGELIDISLTVSPVRDNSGRIIGVSKIARDITLIKKAQAERERLLELEQAARAEAEAANRARDEFLAVVSHELRTPLNAMLGWSELLITQDLSPEHIQQGLEIIQRNIRVQTRLVKDLLDVSRIITGKMRLEIGTVTLVDVINDSIEAMRPEAKHKNVHLRTNLDSQIEPISGDAQRLQQCVWNLLSNAVKFTPAGGDVEVRLFHREDKVVIQVRDTGIGISPNFLPYVFDRLRQGDSSTTRDEGGLGLGLSIVHHIVELHGGTITAESEGEGQGATFTIALPPHGIREQEVRSSKALI